MPVIEMTVYGTEGLIETEGLYEGALGMPYEAVSDQTIVEGVRATSIRSKRLWEPHSSNHRSRTRSVSKVGSG